MTTATRPSKTENAPTLFRGSRSSVAADFVNVQRHNGNYGAGVLHGVALIATGEALGHGQWIDETTLAQVAELANQPNQGVKSRFTHPGMSSDGLGRHLGRITESEVVGDRVLGSLHFQQSATNTPEGDLAAYVMDLAEEDPAAAGLSIVFESDETAELAFAVEHGAKLENGVINWDGFKSPDADNVHNYPHVRLAKLRAADVVDEPAANPDGLFDRQPLAREVDELLSYAAGISPDKPKQGQLKIDGDRAVEYLSRWLESHQLTITKETAMAASTETPEVAPVETKASVVGELKKYTSRFGAEKGVEFFESGIEYATALENHCDALAEKITTLEAELSEAAEKLSSVAIGESEPIEVETNNGEEKKTFAKRLRFASTN